MMNHLSEKQPEFYHDIIEPLQKKKNIQHAYLIETNFVKEKEQYVLDFVEKLFLLKLDENKISKEKLHLLLENNTFPDLKMLIPSGNVIRKEELRNLKNSLQEKAVYEGFQIYIVFEAEKLNASSANTILKFLEEPEENIIAILVTDTRYKMLDTILSRCQVLSLKKEVEEEKEYLPETLFFLKQIANRKHKNLLLNYQELYEKVCSDKQQTGKIIQELLFLFTTQLEDCFLQNEKLEYNQIEASFTEEELLQMLSILQKKQDALQYNINLKLWLNSLLIALMEV